MRNSESFETMESQILDSVTLVAGNGEESSGFSGSDAGDLAFEDSGILIMPPDFDDKDEQEKHEGSAASLSLPESVPSTVGSFTVTNHKEANDEVKESTHKMTLDHEDKNESSLMKDELSEEARVLPGSDFVSMRSGVTWIGYICFVAMLLIHILTFYTKSGGAIQSNNPSFPLSYDEALSRVESLEKQVRDLEKLQNENELLRSTNVHLGNLLSSMQELRRERDDLLIRNSALEDKLESSTLYRREQNKNLTILMNEVDRLTTDVTVYEALHNEANLEVKKAFKSVASLSEERDRLLRKNRRLQEKIKKARKKLDQEGKHSNESFSWETTDETKKPVIDNCWIQVELGECSKEAKSSFRERKQKVTESFWKAQGTAQTTFNDLKEEWKESTSSFFRSSKSENATSKNDAPDYYYDYYDKVQDDIIDYVSNTVESIKTNQHVESIRDTAKSVLTGVAFATAATVIVSSTLISGFFGENSGEDSET